MRGIGADYGAHIEFVTDKEIDRSNALYFGQHLADGIAIAPGRAQLVSVRVDNRLRR